MLSLAEGLVEEDGDGFSWNEKSLCRSHQGFDSWRREPENGEQILGLTQYLNGCSVPKTQINGLNGSQPVVAHKMIS
jgi:hypothetical protein